MKIKNGLRKSVMEAKSIITPAGEPNIRVKPSEMRDALMVYLEKSNYDPIQSLINIAQGYDVVDVPDPDNPENTIKKGFVPSTELRVGIHKEFLRFLAPAMKVSDPDKGAEASFDIYINNFVLNHSGQPKKQAIEAETADSITPIDITPEENVTIKDFTQPEAKQDCLDEQD